MNPRLFAERLRRAREARGLTQQQASDLAGVNRWSLIRWESGDTDPAASAIASLALAYQVTTDYLLGLCARPAGLREGSWLVDGDRLDLLATAEKVRDLRFVVAQSLLWLPYAVEVTPATRVAQEAEKSRIDSQVEIAVDALRHSDPGTRRLVSRWSELEDRWRKALREAGIALALDG